MAPVPQTNTISHFTHPCHRLSMVNATTEYRCDGCMTTGTGVRFRCEPCDFDLHEYCATCPTILSSFMHAHPLNLVQRKPQSARQIERTCNVCCDGVERLFYRFICSIAYDCFYRCKDCDFDVHPLCTQLPQSLRHPLHLPHPLIFQSPGPGWCKVCGSACNSWRYRCVTCGFDIHLKCILNYANQRSVPSFNPSQSPPQHYGYCYGQPSATVPYWGHGQLNVPPAYGGYGYGAGSGLYGNHHHIGNGEIKGNEVKTSMYSLVGKLALGVLNNVDLSSFM